MWKDATEEQREQLRDLRSKIKAQSQKTKEANSTTKNQVTLQYRNEQVDNQLKEKRALASVLDSSDRENEAVAQLGDLENKMRSVFGFMARISKDNQDDTTINQYG
jgi:hypothetical protein